MHPCIITVVGGRKRLPTQAQVTRAHYFCCERPLGSRVVVLLFCLSNEPFFFLGETNRFDLKLKSGELPPGEERGAIEITTQWFYNPNIAAKDKKKKTDFVPRWLQDADSDTEVRSS